MLELAVYTGYPEDGRENLSSTCLPSNLLPGVIFNKARFSANKCHLSENKWLLFRNKWHLLREQKPCTGCPPSPYWLNGALLPAVQPTAGKCQANSREQSDG
jgi:hypothetical protein